MSKNQKHYPVNTWSKDNKNAAIVFADGTIIYGYGLGAIGTVAGEVCFNTSITGYQEILTDPSYTGQIVIFTFPHIGNVGTNADDWENLTPDLNHGAVGAIFKAQTTSASNYRANKNFDDWLKSQNIVAISGIDTRALTQLIRNKGAMNIILTHIEDGTLDEESLIAQARDCAGIEGSDLAKHVSTTQSIQWTQADWQWDKGYVENIDAHAHVVVVDYGVKRNILRLLAKMNIKITIVPAQTSGEEILSLNPDGVFLSNGPGDPAATAEYAVPMIQHILKNDIPIFGICLGHQLLALAVGGQTIKMHQGHHGANHPVKDFFTGKVEIVSMNHGFTVNRDSLPDNVEETHISLFDDTNCGISLKDKFAFSVQYHPEASPGPQDSHYLFQRFKDMIDSHRKLKNKS